MASPNPGSSAMLLLAPARGRDAQNSINRHVLLSVVVFAVLFLGIGGWAAATRIAGTTIAPGRVVADGGSKTVQHREGGIVREILVGNGDSVQSGQVLVRLDDVALRSTLGVLQFQLNAAWASHSRLAAEAVNAEVMVPPPEQFGSGDPDFAVALVLQQQLRATRSQAERSKVDRITEQKRQLQSEIDGLNAQIAARTRVMVTLEEDTTNAEALFDQGLLARTVLNEVYREQAQLEGQIAALTAQIAQSRSTMLELEASQDQLREDFLSSVLSDLQAVNAEISELSQRSIEAETLLGRLELRAPQAGIVHQSMIHTVGGLVAPGETIMLIVPEGGGLSVQARVEPRNFNDIYVGQPVMLDLVAFNPGPIASIKGRVVAMSPDIVASPDGSASHYFVDVAMEPADLARLPRDVRLLGMPVTVIFGTGEKTVLTYLLEPVAQHFRYGLQ